MRLVGLPLMLGLLLSCSVDPTSRETEASAVTKTIGPEGGSILVGGATVTFPAGALTAPREITIAATDADAPAGFVKLSRVFECKPSGTTFAQNVSMRMPFVDDGQGPATMFWSTAEEPLFKDVGGRRDANTLTAEVTHFSAGFVGRKKP
jgi:hypothetical protein